MKKDNRFHDYDAFLQKFEHKKTTDDVYTPSEVYRVILDYVTEICNLKGKTILRPFYPGGDYQGHTYPKNSVVVDNPPFSIISEICKFYLKNKVTFFLFAPHLTLFTNHVDLTHVVVGAEIIYDNGANVKTSFLSNMFGSSKIIGDPYLYAKIKQIQEKGVSRPKYSYPDNLITVSKIQALIRRGIYTNIDQIDASFTSTLDAQQSHKKSIYGRAFFISDNVAQQIKTKNEQYLPPPCDTITWQLSDREKQIIKNLG